MGTQRYVSFGLPLYFVCGLLFTGCSTPDSDRGAQKSESVIKQEWKQDSADAQKKSQAQSPSLNNEGEGVHMMIK